MLRQGDACAALGDVKELRMLNRFVRSVKKRTVQDVNAQRAVCPRRLRNQYLELSTAQRSAKRATQQQIGQAVLAVRNDASAGRSIAVRRGAGKIRHIATPTL